jgi:DNA polymerase
VRDWKTLKSEVENCTKCNLHKTRTRVVFGVGDVNASLMIVGEAPGYYEDKKGEPFVGSAGKLLDELLESIGLKRDEIYISNVLKCRPPDNRDPLPEEVAMCSPYLIEQISYINPRLIVTLGNHSTHLLADTNLGMTKVHGQVFKRENYLVFPTFHPAACLYHPEWMKLLKKDFLKISELLRR